MGRPLNKKFFGNAAGRIACTARIGGGNELCFITSQRSNSKYAVDSEAGPSTRSGICTLVDGAPTAENEMQVTVQAENAEAIRQATVTVAQTGGIIDSITILDAGYGYWAPGTGVAIPGGTGGTGDFTVDGNGSIATVIINNAGTGYSDGAQNFPGAPDANPPLQNARIINARTVKTFPAVGGSTFLWPIVGTDDGAGPSGRTEADLQSQ